MFPTSQNDGVRSLATYDDGNGERLYVGKGAIPNTPGVYRWDGGGWTGLGGFTPLLWVASRTEALAVIDLGLGQGPTLVAGGSFTAIGGVPMPGIGAWNGTSWTSVGNPTGIVVSLHLEDDGTGQRLWAMGSFSLSNPSADALALWTCPMQPSLGITQPSGPGGPVFVVNANLTPGREVLNVFSPDFCPGGPGSGSPSLFGLCTSDLNVLIAQVTQPLGTYPFRFTAPESYVVSGPYSLPVGLTVDAICGELAGGALVRQSNVVRLVVQ